LEVSSQPAEIGPTPDAALGRPFGQSTWEAQVALLQQLIADSIDPSRDVVLLEAGCGQFPSPLGLEGKARIVGVDTSAAQLERNTWADEKIQADIVTHPLATDSYDVVVCWDVLEHLPAPEPALDNLLRATRPDGLLVLKVPNVMSAKGLVTKFTPHWFHIWIYRHVFGYTNPGVGDRPPFRTYLRWSIRPGALREFSRRRGLVLEMLGTYEADKQQGIRESLHLDGRLWRGLRGAVRLLTLRTVDPVATELIAVFRKPRA
jgi:SAM-dependent methyltransferase